MASGPQPGSMSAGIDSQLTPPAEREVLQLEAQTEKRPAGGDLSVSVLQREE